MATIVKNLKSDKEYILLGTGFGLSQAQANDHSMIDSLTSFEYKQQLVISVCDSAGAISYMDYKDVVVVSVDGQLPQSTLV